MYIPTYHFGTGPKCVLHILLRTGLWHQDDPTERDMHHGMIDKGAYPSMAMVKLVSMRFILGST